MDRLRIYIVLFLGITAHLAVFGQEKDQINDLISQTSIQSHLSFLASDALRGRNTGSAGLEAAAAYIGAQFMRSGVDTMEGYGDYLMTIPFNEVVPPDSGMLYIGNQQLVMPDDFFVLNGQTQQSTMPGKYLNFGGAQDFDSTDVRFNFAITNVGDGLSQDVGAALTEAKSKRERAIEAGAMGMIEIYQNPLVPWKFLKRMGSQKRVSSAPIEDKRQEQFPHIWISTNDSIAIAHLTSGKHPIRLEMDGLKKSPLPSSNVLGWVEGTDAALKNEYIVYSAHYDHVGIGRADMHGDSIYNGARDNAVGTTAILALAEYIAKYPTKRSALFVLFTAEEKGLLGSSWFVNHSPVALEKIKYCFNIDNGGYNDTSIVSVIGLTRTEAESSIMEACEVFGLEAIEDPAGEQGLFDRSDNVNFAKMGIPAPTFSLGFRAFDEEIFKYYHQPSDEVQSLDLDYIEKYVKSFILSAIKIGNGNKAPFWKEGDKYFETGKELYGY